LIIADVLYDMTYRFLIFMSFNLGRHKWREWQSQVRNTIGNWPRRHSRTWWGRMRSTVGWRRRLPKVDRRIFHHRKFGRNVCFLRRGARTDVIFFNFPGNAGIPLLRYKNQSVILLPNCSKKKCTSRCSQEDHRACQVNKACGSFFSHFLFFVNKNKARI